ncbi:hypothetical protein Nepgr_003783 [Nepenthes gracilis]|uniref:Retrotransposon gag domain-containing protein n=1 Tax=Nepenthes gracilis TaxID=150966 RepID=A0AAD3S062_NEPGR|nr:hypothetical protein Nepgr_003783 [Nepenthes gracilis]
MQSRHPDSTEATPWEHGAPRRPQREGALRILRWRRKSRCCGTPCARRSPRPPRQSPQSPFAMDSGTQPATEQVRNAVMEGYDGSKDPMDHLNCFRTHLTLQGASEALMCQSFPVTLRGDALLWFHGLPPNSICSFDELADSFLSQFASSRREERQPWHLVRLRQRTDESLKRFLDRFITEARRIPHLSDELKLNAFVATLAAGDFFKHLSHQRPQTFREAETIARAYITAEEANEAKRPERADRPPETSRASGGRKRDGDSQRFMERRKQQRPPPGPKKDYSRASLTPLNDSRTNILMQIQDERFFKWPKTPKGPSRQMTDKVLPAFTAVRALDRERRTTAAGD